MEIYQHDHQLIINAKSEANFLMILNLQLLLRENVDVIGRTLTGRSEKTKDNERIIAEIIIQEKGSTLLDKKINFLEKSFEAIKVPQK